MHRSGRTGRAGKNGVCITFFSHREKYLLKEIEEMANIRFRQIAEPRQADIAKANMKEIINKIKSID